MNSRTFLAPKSAALLGNGERMGASRYRPCTFCGSMMGTLRKADASCSSLIRQIGAETEPLVAY
jgi:hypothetical protein